MIKILIPIFLISLFHVSDVYGVEQRYYDVARNFLDFVHSKKQILSSEEIEKNRLDPTSQRIPIAYLMKLRGGGFILISGSSHLTPIKAYSLETEFENLPEAYKDFILLEMEYNTRALQDKSVLKKLFPRCWISFSF